MAARKQQAGSGVLLATIVFLALLFVLVSLSSRVHRVSADDQFNTPAQRQDTIRHSPRELSGT